jgi:hypothetical protein
MGYYAGDILATDGTIATVNDNMVFTASTSASALNPAADSWGLTFRGEAWNTASSTTVVSSFTLLTDIMNATTSRFTIRSTSGTDLLTVDQEGDATIAGDLSIGGRLHPSYKGGGAQNEWYIFADNTLSTSSVYIATNADGWQSMDTYDFAERYYSPDALEAGDLVTVSETDRTHVQRTLDESKMVLGIVSTRPAFIAGRPATDTYPIALSGRVPTKVSGMNGVIKAGDPLAPTTIPGVAAKAVHTGPMVGLALEDYDGADVGSIEVFVNPGWWTNKDEAQQTTVVNQTVVNEGTSIMRRGVAMIAAGSKKVRVTYDSISAYPFVQVTPRGLIQGNWGTDNYSDVGFDIVLSEEQSFDTYFSWQVEPLQGGDQLNLSDGTTASIDPVTGLPFGFTTPTSTEPIVEGSSTTTESLTAITIPDVPTQEIVSTSTDSGDTTSSIINVPSEGTSSTTTP